MSAILAYAVTAHLVFASGSGSRLVAVFAWAPLAFTTLWLLRNSAYRSAALGVVVIITLALWLLWPAHGMDPGPVYLGQYVAMQVALAAVFGRSLMAGQEPLVTRIARLVHQQLPPPIERYTRNVTLAWAVFFIAMAVVAILLYVWANRAVWSAFVNLLTVPCLGAMFGAEYVVRRWRYPWFDHASILAGIRTFRRAMRSPEQP